MKSFTLLLFFLSCVLAFFRMPNIPSAEIMARVQPDADSNTISGHYIGPPGTEFSLNCQANDDDATFTLTGTYFLRVADGPQFIAYPFSGHTDTCLPSAQLHFVVPWIEELDAGLTLVAQAYATNPTSLDTKWVLVKKDEDGKDLVAEKTLTSIYFFKIKDLE